MFKKGDIIVCADSEHLPESLTLGKRYKVLHSLRLVEVRNDNNAAHSYSKSRFITIEQDRRLKLEKLCLKLEVK